LRFGRVLYRLYQIKGMATALYALKDIPTHQPITPSTFLKDLP